MVPLNFAHICALTLTGLVVALIASSFHGPETLIGSAVWVSLVVYMATLCVLAIGLNSKGVSQDARQRVRAVQILTALLGIVVAGGLHFVVFMPRPLIGPDEYVAGYHIFGLFLPIVIGALASLAVFCWQSQRVSKVA